MIVTHHHPDDAGGIRPFIARDVPVVTTPANVAYFEDLARADFHRAPDRLWREPRRPRFVTVNAHHGLAEIGCSGNMGSVCQLSTEGTVFCWDFDEWGELGDGMQRLGSACGQLLCWGEDTVGLLGEHDVFADIPTPTQISNAADIVDVDLFNDHGCVIRSSGQVACWGGDVGGETGPERRYMPVNELQPVRNLPGQGQTPVVERPDEDDPNTPELE